MEFIKYDTEIIARWEDETGIHKLGLGSESWNKNDLELKIIAQQKYDEIKFREANPPAPSYKELRAKEYPRTDELVVALWELVVEKRPETANELQAKREAVKQKYPKT